jgi:hypothetical protein
VVSELSTVYARYARDSGHFSVRDVALVRSGKGRLVAPTPPRANECEVSRELDLLFPSLARSFLGDLLSTFVSPLLVAFNAGRIVGAFGGRRGGEG